MTTRERTSIETDRREPLSWPHSPGVLKILPLLLPWIIFDAIHASGNGSDLAFARDIQPILSEHCYPCHGPDSQQRKADLRLDLPENAFLARDHGRVITPEDPERSLLIQRIESNDPEERMPPPSSNRVLTRQQKQRLRKWIETGAPYDSHWAWDPPRRPALPLADRNPGWPRNAIDHFILKDLSTAGLQPSPEADRPTLIRRLSLDLTGLPPTLAEGTQYLGDASPLAYETLVRRLLESPHYGERMAVDWLDAARYADTNGYQVDRDRETYAWRDWVINAFNENKPFDQFTVEQLAGDLLPRPTLPQLIATGFNRNHMMNEEGGIIPEEFLAEYCADRVETTATIWLGQTFLCARCHDHKFDPFTQKDYYSFYAFFHHIEEQGRGNYGAPIRRNNPPMLQLPAPELEAKRDQLKLRLGERKRALSAAAEDSPERKQLETEVEALSTRIDEVDLEIPTALIMRERSEPRQTHVLVRGAYDQPGEPVTARTPLSLPPMEADWPRNRLGLAKWLIHPNHPLTARVTVNRLWQRLFGKGLVATPENFGTRGALPTHPQLLDWLAVEFVESGWNVKALVRLMVTSATYRQSSRVPAGARERDPGNRLYSRTPRYRLQAEAIRDQALAVSGLLLTTIGGPSVRPYHPPGLYEQVVAGKGAKTYREDQGAGLYRRTLYSYWKRSVPNPALLAFDAPFRETCVVKRSRTNTPMQALNLMNDPTFVEASRVLAAEMIEHGGSEFGNRLDYGFRRTLGRPPQNAELDVLKATIQRSLADFQAFPGDAQALVETGRTPLPTTIAPTELAAYSIAASILLNLDETITRE